MCCFSNSILCGLIFVLIVEVITGILICIIVNVFCKYNIKNKKIAEETKLREKYINRKEFSELSGKIEEIEKDIRDLKRQKIEIEVKSEKNKNNEV